MSSTSDMSLSWKEVNKTQLLLLGSTQKHQFCVVARSLYDVIVK